MLLLKLDLGVNWLHLSLSGLIWWLARQWNYLDRFVVAISILLGAHDAAVALVTALAADYILTANM